MSFFRGDTIIYTINGTVRLDDLSKNDLILDKDGNYKEISELNKSVYTKKMYKIKLHNSIDNVFLTKNCKVYSIQNIPYELKNFEIRNYIETEKKSSLPKLVPINELTDFDFIGYPKPSFSEETYGETPDYYRFYGLIVSSGFSNNFLLDTIKNKNTIFFIKKFLLSRNITYEEKHNETDILLSFPDNNLNIKKFNYKFNNLNKECSIELLKGLIELSIKDNEKSFIYYKTNFKFYVYILKFLLMKFGILISVFFYKDNNDDNVSYYVIRIPNSFFIKSIFEIDNKDILENIETYKDDDNNLTLNYFEYDNYIWTKVKFIKLIPYNGSVFDIKLKNNSGFITELGLINNSTTNI